MLPYIDVEQMAQHLSLLHEGARGGFCLAWVAANDRTARWQHGWLAGEAGDTRDLYRQFTGDPDNVEYWRNWLVQEQKHWQLYTSVGSFRKSGTKYRRQQKLSAQLPGMWADLDVQPNVENRFSTREQLDKFLGELPQPSVIVDTGSGGCHPYWLLKRRTTTNQRVENLLSGWHAYLQEVAEGVLIDNVQETSRVLRVAGSVRWTKPSELAVGSKLFTRVELKHVTNRRYTIDELEELVAPALTRLRQREVEKRERYLSGRTASLDALERRNLTRATQQYLEARFNELEDWGKLLERAGWTLNRDNRGTGGNSACRYWTVPGGDVVGHAGASTDYEDSSVITFFSSGVDNLDELIHPGIPQAMNGCTTKYRFALITLFGGDEGQLLRSIHEGKGRLS